MASQITLQANLAAAKAQVARTRRATAAPASAQVPTQARNVAAAAAGRGAAKVNAASAIETSAATVQASDYGVRTLGTWLLEQEKRGQIDSEMAIVLSSISLACKQIATLVNRSGISNLTGVAGATNVQGEDQKKLDVISNEVFSNCLRSCGKTGVLASEEEDEPVFVEETTSGNYVVVFDPLDGSSNIDAGISVGTIFGIYAPQDGCEVDMSMGADEVVKQCVVNVCQPGENLLCAGYCLYSSASIMVLTVGDGVYGFTLDPLVGEFVLTHDRIQVPEVGKIYAFNEGNMDLWDESVQEYIKSLKKPDNWGGKPYSARYIGSLVGDFHRTMLYGGIYGYPGDSKNPNGKLRLLYECAPMSFIAEQAGGVGSTGKVRVLDIEPEAVHQRVPLFVGSKKEVEYLESFTK
ncbi:unnamed protein product [Pedinophyceae sp. YPF-701]|nr:unnamed protein product [Pedinophyceae sp. YPF-701]